MSKKSLRALISEMSLVPQDSDEYQQVFMAEVTENWTQGRACFGGLQGALAVNAMSRVLDDPVPLRSLLVSFVAPIAVGPVRIEVRRLRQGRHVTQVHGEIIQRGAVCCVLNGCFGSGRSSTIEQAAKPFPDNVLDVDGLVDLPYIKGLTPEFTTQYHMRWGVGGLPFTRQKGNTTGLWVKSREPGISTLEDLVIVADLPPTPALSKLGQPAPASSLTWMLEILEDDFVARNDDWWFVETTLDHFSHGYGQQQYTIYTPDQTPVALGRQVVTVFD